ncbi:hypothetical protein ACQYRI_06085 [Salmonella enterica]
MNRIAVTASLLAMLIIAILAVLLANSRADLKVAESDKRVLESDNQLQGEVITSQAFNFQRFNQIAEHTSHLNLLIDANTEKTVIKYREILRREKTCDFPVPADIAHGLLDYTYRLRASAMHTDSGVADSASDSSVTAHRLTYCQAVLWLKPLLGAIEKANSQLIAIRQEEQNMK